MKDTHFEIDLHKKPRGYMDFATSIDMAEKQSVYQPAKKIIRIFENCFESAWLEAHPPSTLTYKNIRILENTDLKLGIALAPEVYLKPGEASSLSSR